MLAIDPSKGDVLERVSHVAELRLHRQRRVEIELGVRHRN
jgi:hypothetical protein